MSLWLSFIAASLENSKVLTAAGIQTLNFSGVLLLRGTAISALGRDLSAYEAHCVWRWACPERKHLFLSVRHICLSPLQVTPKGSVVDLWTQRGPRNILLPQSAAWHLMVANGEAWRGNDIPGSYPILAAILVGVSLYQQPFWLHLFLSCSDAKINGSINFLTQIINWKPRYLFYVLFFPLRYVRIIYKHFLKP